MVLLANPRGNHFTHLALLGSLLLFDFLAMTMSAALVHEGKVHGSVSRSDRNGRTAVYSSYAFRILFQPV
jgi:hypothetical protein